MQYKNGDLDLDLGLGFGWDDGFNNNSNGSNGGNNGDSNDGGGKTIWGGEPIIFALVEVYLLDFAMDKVERAVFIGGHGATIIAVATVIAAVVVAVAVVIIATAVAKGVSS